MPKQNLTELYKTFAEVTAEIMEHPDVPAKTYNAISDFTTGLLNESNLLDDAGLIQTLMLPVLIRLSEQAGETGKVGKGNSKPVKCDSMSVLVH